MGWNIGLEKCHLEKWAGKMSAGILIWKNPIWNFGFIKEEQK